MGIYFRVLVLMSCLVWPLCSMAQSDGLALLGQFLQQVRSGRAQFTQTVTSVPRAGMPPRVKTSSGTLEFQRPGRFRFVYRKPFEQVLVADGQTLWLHDVDLQQVTARKQAQVLANTPLALITSASQISELEVQFRLQAEAPSDGLQWVKAMPKAADTQIQQVLAGLRAGDKGPELVVLDVLDALGQRSLLRFSGFEVNAPVSAEVFRFQPPAGVDVIRP